MDEVLTTQNQGEFHPAFAMHELRNGPLEFAPPANPVRSALADAAITTASNFVGHLVILAIGGALFGGDWLLIMGMFVGVFLIVMVGVAAPLLWRLRNVRRVIINASGLAIISDDPNGRQFAWTEVARIKKNWSGQRYLITRSGETYRAYNAATVHAGALDTIIQSIVWFYKSRNFHTDPLTDARKAIAETGIVFPPQTDYVNAKKARRKLFAISFLLLSVSVAYILYFRQFGPDGMFCAVIAWVAHFAAIGGGVIFLTRLGPRPLFITANGVFHKDKGQMLLKWSELIETKLTGVRKIAMRHPKKRKKIPLEDYEGVALLQAVIFEALNLEHALPSDSSETEDRHSSAHIENPLADYRIPKWGSA